MTTQTTTEFKVMADILDPDDGEAFIGEVFSGLVLKSFPTLRSAQANLRRNRAAYEALARERIANAQA